ncbi:Hint domain-containing protein [Salipiger sp.]|uniref:Hint domain-containing protein n=1 Tax=Salipiger sp. TaxID=2078585 RepID=UPI003A985C66
MEPKTVRRDDGRLPARHIDSPKPLNALLAGTIVLTLDGALPVEALCPGDRVITRDSGTAVLRAARFSRRRVGLVALTASVFGKGRPDGELRLPAEQEILLRDWRAAALFGASRALVPVSRLVDGTHVRHIGHHEVGLLELSFDAPHVIYAGGLELASSGKVSIPA